MSASTLAFAGKYNTYAVLQRQGALMPNGILPEKGSHALTILLRQCAMVGDLHCDTCLLPKVALPKVQVARLEADARAGQLHPDACQNRQHLSCHCHLQKESTVSRFHRVAACPSACRHSKDSVGGVDDTGSAHAEAVPVVPHTQHASHWNADFSRPRSAPVKITCTSKAITQGQ